MCIYIIFALLLKYEAIITPGNEHVVHHMEVFHCDSTSSSSKNSVLEEFPIWEGPCGSDDAPEKLSQCKRVLAAWAIGAGPFVYPKVWRVLYIDMWYIDIKYTDISREKLSNVSLTV